MVGQDDLSAGSLEPMERMGRLLDGLRAVPVATGRVRIDGAELQLLAADGERRSWPIHGVIDVQRIGTEVHLELPPLGSASGTNPPTAKLIVEGRGFLEAVEEAQARFGSSGRATVQRARRRLGLAGWVLIAALVVPLAYLAYTIAVPSLHVLISPEKEAALGEHVFEAASEEWKILQSEAFERVVQPMVEELQGPNSPYDFRVTLIDDDLINAMALPGGRIMVFKGLITAAPSADALAGVLAHEMAHVEERHGLKHILRSLGTVHFAFAAVGGGIDGFEAAETIVELSSGLLILKHSRHHEREADRVAVRRLVEAGRRPSGLVEFFEVLEEEMGGGESNLQWMSTHPLTKERIADVEALIEEAMQSRDPDADAQDRDRDQPWMSEAEWIDFQRLFQSDRGRHPSGK
ncbi:TPR repeat-containing protein YfgC precursor [Planctomycetes bacterium Poly30]|uniref:TPR repeat-containing protein YfgC n=1 Tax=Saltatorellus ferox TaxID=2528018 RepID=A0A518EV15_9BACT|nr:TPR repeat-containing protein YfgC precursor [Planctomycetes bacterium Poly30]